MTQAEPQLRLALQIATDKAVFVHRHLQGGSAGIVDGRRAVFFGQREHAQDVAKGRFSWLSVEGVAELADVGPGYLRSAHQLAGTQRRLLGTVLVLDPVATARLA